MRTIIFNKPFGVLSQFTDEGTGHPTLKQFIDVPNVYAAGRLDRDSEGLLLLTNDGSLIKRLTDPKHHFEKTYWVLVEGDPTQDKLTQLETGIHLKGYRTLPAQARLLGQNLLLRMDQLHGLRSSSKKGRSGKYVI